MVKQQNSAFHLFILVEYSKRNCTNSMGKFEHGYIFRVAESQIDAVTGISGSGPAYMYLILEALTEEGVSVYIWSYTYS